MNVLDRFLSLNAGIAISKYQLLGVACFLVASKFEETVSPSVQELSARTEEECSPEAIIQAERYVLKSIGWDLSYAGPMSWLRRGSRADQLDPNARTLAKYLLHVGVYQWRLIAIPPSLLAAASLWLARLTLEKDDWVRAFGFISERRY